MALEGAQGGDARGDRERSADSRDGHAATPGLAPRQDRRFQSFAYDSKGFQGENLTYAILTQPSQGWVTNNGDGTFSFDPGLDFRDLKAAETRRVSFSYQVSDGWSGAETESATLVVTGTPDGTLTIEVAAGTTGRRSAPSGPAAPADSARSGALPPELQPAQAADTSVDAAAPGFTGISTNAPAAGRSDAEFPPPVEAPEGTVPKIEATAVENADTGRSNFDRAATGPTMAALEPKAEDPVLEPESGNRGPRAHDLDSNPHWGNDLPQTIGEHLAAPDPGVGPRAGLENTAADPPGSADLPLKPEDDTPGGEPRTVGSEPSPVAPASRPDGDRRRYTILAQPSEGRVDATDDGGFDFTPGAGFPELAVGELEQVSFTCEATDAAGTRSIVIASLTVTGTSDGPEVCDVTYRQAQGTDATQRPTPRADNDQADSASHAAQKDPHESAGHWPEPIAADLAMDGGSGENTSAAQGVATPHQGGLPAVAGLTSDGRGNPPEWRLAAETPDPGPGPSSPIWQPDSEIGAEALAPDPLSAPEHPADTFPRSDGGETPEAGSSYGSQQDDTAAWKAAAEMLPEIPAPPTRQAQFDDGPTTFGQSAAPVVESTAETPAMPDGGDTLAESEPYTDPQVEPAAPAPTMEAPAEASSLPLRQEDPLAEGASGLGPATEPTTWPSAKGSAPSDSGPTTAISNRYEESRTEPAVAGTASDDSPSTDDYRGAVAAEAVTTFLPDDSGARNAGQSTADQALETAPEDLATGPESIGVVPAAEMVPDTQGDALDGLFGAADPDASPTPRDPDPDDGAPARTDNPDAGSTGLTAPAEPPPDAPPEAGPEPTAVSAESFDARDAFVEGAADPIAPADETEKKFDLALVDAEESANDPAELSDFVLSQNTVVEKSEIGTVVGQVVVTGAEQDSRFIFDLQNDAGGRFDINPRTGKVTVADGALLDHQAADSHDILVQVIAHSGVSCRKTLTIMVLPADASSAVDRPAAASEVANVPVPEDAGAAQGLALQPENGRAGEPAAGNGAQHSGIGVPGGGMVDTLHLDGVSGGPGLGGWTLELTEGEVVETNDDNLMLSEESAGAVILDGCPVKVTFEGVERIEW